jgi:voltage-gated potassium channel
MPFVKKRINILWSILKHTQADRLLYSYVAFIFGVAFFILLSEPSIKTYGDALWYCYAVISTAGFGDVVVTSRIAKLLSVALTVYSVLLVAIITGVVVNYYNQIMERRDNETLVAFLDRLEDLDNLSKEEMHELSSQVKHFRDRLNTK